MGVQGYRFAEMAAAGYNSGNKVGALPVKLAYLVEEDIFVAQDFFVFHRAVHGGAVAGLGPTVDPQHWALIHSVMAHNLDTTGSPYLLKDCRATLAAAGSEAHAVDTVANVVYTMPHFASLGVSIQTANLSRITDHSNGRYYTNMARYIQETFPKDDRSPTDTPEQDGVIDRTYRKAGLRTVWARCPRAFHAGFLSSYHPQSMEGHRANKMKHLNKLDGTTLPARYASLNAKMAAELSAPGSAFKDRQSVVVPTEGYFVPSMFYCKNFDNNRCAQCLGCCPCDTGGLIAADGGPYYPSRQVEITKRCDYTMHVDCFIGGCDFDGHGCQRLQSRELPESICAMDPKCKGLTEYVDDGVRFWETRSGGRGASPTGEKCWVKEKCHDIVN